MPHYRCFISIFLVQVIITVSANETTTVLPSLTNTTGATMTTTTLTKSSAGSLIVLNLPRSTIKEQSTIPSTTLKNTTFFARPPTKVQSQTKPELKISVTTTVTYETMIVTKSPDNRTFYCYPAELLEPTTEKLTVTTNNTQNNTVTTNATRALGNTNKTKFFDLTLRKKWMVDMITTDLQNTRVNETVPLKNSTAPSSTKEQTVTEMKSSLVTTKPQEVIEYEELSTKPFSKYFELFLHRLTELDHDSCATFVIAFAKRMKSVLQEGNLQHFGPTLPGDIERWADAVIATPRETIAQYVRKAYIAIMYHRKVLSYNVNLLLDYMDLVYTVQDEEAMESILNDTLAFPNNNKTIYDIVETILRKVVLVPSWRIKLSGNQNGLIIFEYLDKIINQYNAQAGLVKPHKDNGYLEKNMTQFKEINTKFVEKHRKGRVKIAFGSRKSGDASIIENSIKKKKAANKAIQRRNNDFEETLPRNKKRTKYEFTRKIYRTRSISKRDNDFPTEAYSHKNWNLKMKREKTYSPMRIQNQYSKSNFYEPFIYQKHKRNNKGYIDSNMRQRVTFMEKNSEFTPFHISPAQPQSNTETMAAFNNGFMKVLNPQRDLKKDFDTEIPQPYPTPVVSTKTYQNEVSKMIQRFGDNVEVHKYIVTKTPNYMRMQPATVSITPDYTEFISFEINNISDIVNIGMKLQFQKKASSPHNEASANANINFQANKVETTANSEPTLIAATATSKSEVRLWSPYKIETYSEKSKALVSNDATENVIAANSNIMNEVRLWSPYNMEKYTEKSITPISDDAKQNMILRTNPTEEVDKDMSIINSYAFTLAKGLEIPVLGEMKNVETTPQHYKNDYYAYKMRKHHAKMKRGKHKHKIHKHGRRESIKRHFRKGKFNKKNHERKLRHRNYKRQRHHRKRHNNKDKYKRKNDNDLWDYYLKRAKETDQSDTENSLDSSQDNAKDSLLTEYEQNNITSNGDGTNNYLEIKWYKKDKSVEDQSTTSEYSQSSKEDESDNKTSKDSRIKEYEDVSETSSEQLQKKKLSNRIQSNEHKRKDYVTRSQLNKPKYSYSTKKRFQTVKPLKQMGVYDIFRYTLSADIDRIKQQVAKDIEYNKAQYFKRMKHPEKLPHNAKTPTSSDDRSVKAEKAHNLYVKDLKVHKNIIDVRRNEDDLRRQPQNAKKAFKFSTANTVALMDSVYSDEEKELRENLHDALRHEDRIYHRRNLNHDSTPETGLRDNSEYTDTEVLLKQKVYKAINDMM